MPSHIYQRPATEAELAFLRSVLAKAPSTAYRWRRAVSSAFVQWAVSLLAVAFLWFSTGWVGSRLFDLALDRRTPATWWVLGIAALLCGVWAVVSTARWVRGWEDLRPQLKADIDAAQIDEEHHALTEAKRFQAPEHGGLLYFLRTAEDKVFTLYDLESQELGLRNGDPLQSSFRPLTQLALCRAPTSAWVVGQSFSGEALALGAPIELAARPEDWPEPASYCDIPWSELEAKFGPRL